MEMWVISCAYVKHSMWQVSHRDPASRWAGGSCGHLNLMRAYYCQLFLTVLGERHTRWLCEQFFFPGVRDASEKLIFYQVSYRDIKYLATVTEASESRSLCQRRKHSRLYTRAMSDQQMCGRKRARSWNYPHLLTHWRCICCQTVCTVSESSDRIWKQPFLRVFSSRFFVFFSFFF